MLPPPPQDSPVKSSRAHPFSEPFWPRPAGRPKTRIPKDLFHFDGSASIGKFLLDAFGLFLVDALFHGLRSAIHQVLGFLQTQTRDFADSLDYIDLIGTHRGQDDGKFG